MKFTNFMAVLALILMTSCEGEESISPDVTLVGTWELQDFTVKMETETTFSNKTTTMVADVEGENLNYDLTFSEGAYNTSGSYGYKLDMEIDGDKSSSNLSVSSTKGDGTYTLNGMELTSEGAFFNIEFQGLNFDLTQGEVTTTIEKLTEKELVLYEKTAENIEQNISGNPFLIETKLEAKSVWKRK